MSPTIMAIRAVTSEYARELLRPLLFTGVGVYIVVIAIIIWIAVEVSWLWLLLAFTPTLLFIVALAVWIGIWTATRRLAPSLNKQQQKATRKVVRQVGVVAEQIGTPRFILIFRIAKDVVSRPKSNQTLIGELAETPGQLHRSFVELRNLFR